jgi:hypothetical protein
MTTREKIIVGLMLLTVGYGAIELFVPRAPVGPVTAQPGQSAEGLNTFIAKVADAVKTDATGAGDVLIKKAETDWKQDPLLAIRKTAPKVEEKPTVKEAGRPSLPNLTYSGFLEIGAKRLAIINGMEYEAGDRLVSGGLTVKSVLPNKVIMTSSQGEIVLPLQESE